MKPNQKSPPNEVARLSGLEAASERAEAELSEFIDFIQYHNPNIDRTAATMTAAYYLRYLPAIFLDDPKAMEQLRAIATKFSQS